MRSPIVIHSFCGENDTATIVIDKNGMSVTDKGSDNRFSPDSHYYRHFIYQCIDMDSWQHSRHLSVEKAMRKRTKERRKCREIMLEKIQQRENEIKFLKDGIQILGRCQDE